MKRLAIATAFLFAISLPGCNRQQPAATSSAASTPTKTYHLRGKVVSTDAAKSEVTLDHEAIPGFMAAMTMPYALKDPTILSELHPGDTVTADLLVNDQCAMVDHFVVVAQSKPDYKPGILYHIPKPGDEVPDFKLLNQSNQVIHLDQFKGKAVLLTFIYTRCPLADFCPRMSKNFAKIDKALTPDLIGKTHLLSVSFDPDYDTPAVCAVMAAHIPESSPTRNSTTGILRHRQKAICPRWRSFLTLAQCRRRTRQLRIRFQPC